ncbi:MAG: DUF4012 domain-containing protein, partial [bacterium]|nr:DUF4012 domain-containing protein [bacterium]
MTKKVKDLKLDPQIEKIDLGGANSKKKVQSIEKDANKIYKESLPVKAVKDLSIEQDFHYIYIKGKKYVPPKYLGNLLKIALVGFLIIIAINGVSLYQKGKTLEANIADQAYEGYNFLVDAGKSATKIEFDSALALFETARDNFSQAKDSLWFINSDKTFYVKNKSTGQAVAALLEGGKYFAIAGKYFLDTLEEFNKIPLYFVSKNKDPKGGAPSITDTLKRGLEKTDLAIEQIYLAAEEIESIDESTLPDDIGARVAFAKGKVKEVSKILELTKQHFPALLKLLGDRYPHRYLILLQNNKEIRPTGGFIGSYAIMDLNEGYIEKLETYDVYDIDGSYGGLIEPPEELKAFTNNWRFRDSNYSPDFPISAQKARWFLQKEGGPTVDTVIGINEGLLADMLEITGPIQVGSFGELNSKNYSLLLSYVIEGKVWGAKDPKHILKVFIPLFKEAILKEENIGRVGSKMYKAIQQKHIMMYSADEDIQALFSAVGLSGEVYKTQEGEDYLSVINSAIGGTKSEPFIEEQIFHDSVIDENGNIIDEIRITREHHWNDDIYFAWRKTLKSYGFDEMPDSLIDILGRGANKVNTRIYVPAGSVLIDSTAADTATKYDKELKKT